jgi:hypothetical protein
MKHIYRQVRAPAKEDVIIAAEGRVVELIQLSKRIGTTPTEDPRSTP